ncbi:MAG: Gfo/Idh/MocA family oxidoreductase [Acidobacteriia bacterium]|nr:Gfo/Idh/MocA family oxidoreductase [Terriglobia bacterium]
MSVSRRTALAAAFSIVPRHVLGGAPYVAPSDKVTLAFVGTGTQGIRVMLEFLPLPDVQAVAVCDVNSGSSDYLQYGTNELRNRVRKLIPNARWGYESEDSNHASSGCEPARQAIELFYAQQNRAGQHHGCAVFADYRELLAQRKDIDGIVVGTPDHSHAVISIAAMRAGKHVFCQKPMAHSVLEARKMAEVARQTGVATEVAIWNSASDATRVLAEWIQAGAIGQVRQVHNWTNRPSWPQGIERPAEAQPVPPYLNWDLWLGPAPFRPYHRAYQPWVFRGWYDFGTGSAGDMGCYSFDPIFRALKLKAPDGIEASSTRLFPESFPQASIVHYSFPARDGMPPVKVSWYDAGLKPPRPEGLPDNEKLAPEGMHLLGEKGALLCDFYGAKPRLLPESRLKSFTPPPPTLPRVAGGYEAEWIAACTGGQRADANFEFTSSVTETLLLGNVAIRSGEKLNWDRERVRTGSASADQLLHSPCREGWSL